MEQHQYIQFLLENKGSNSIQRVDTRHDFIEFVGTPKKHPVDKNILVLLTNPFEKNKHYYEFSLDSICDIEELNSVSADNGETAYQVRIWVHKGSLAFKTEPFIVT
ncbi:MAG: inorganic pyrophosphatase Ppa [Spirochaetes bacterium]|nr:inorganic pyrophosphatase Ppa [Spirochaetota bacterium]MBN2770344.1 inorganic pyrophosphatase Ppa [Spirochaetota bacterium]HRX16876.1 inorganic pyrophosphatase Ppa [Spirochaetota bacterium]